MKHYTVNTISKDIQIKDAADLDHALSVAGFGIYNIKYTIVLSLFLIGAVIEPVGYSYVLPASKCDLDMTDTMRGFVASIPFIGIVLTSFFWGYLVDTRGRKMTIIYSSFAAGTLGIAAAFMPNLITFIIFKFLTALCLACPGTVPYTYIGEITPVKYRDVMLTVINTIQICSATLVPLLAWAILPLELELDFGMYYFRPWRLLAIVNPSLFIVAAFLLLWGPESPKFLMSQGRQEESFEILRTMYAQNKRRSPHAFPVTKLKFTETIRDVSVPILKSIKEQSVPLLSPPHLKWMALNSTLMFGVYITGNGLYMWLPDILNRVFSGDAEGTACEIIARSNNETGVDATECIDTIDQLTFIVNSAATAGSGVVAMIVIGIVGFIGKKALIVAVYCIIGVFCILINVVEQQIVFAMLLASIALMGLAIGPINAYSIQLFPTHLRGMAVALTMMVGRIGSVAGANMAGALLNTACEATFYLFGGILIFCGLLGLLLPRSKVDVK